MNREVHEWRDDTLWKRFWRVRMMRTYTSLLVECYDAMHRGGQRNSTVLRDTLHCLTCNAYGLFWLYTLYSLFLLMLLCNVGPTFSFSSALYRNGTICSYSISKLSFFLKNLLKFEFYSNILVMFRFTSCWRSSVIGVFCIYRLITLMACLHYEQTKTYYMKQIWCYRNLSSTQYTPTHTHRYIRFIRHTKLQHYHVSRCLSIHTFLYLFIYWFERFFRLHNAM